MSDGLDVTIDNLDSSDATFVFDFDGTTILMGSVATITAHAFPKQGPSLNRRTKVIFHYGGPELMGSVVRDDYEHPWRTIIRLDDGRYIMSSECQYAPETD